MSRYAQNGNVPALMELLIAATRKPADPGDFFGSVDAAALNDLQSRMIGAARVMGLSDEKIDKALYETHDGPVFYYP